VSRHDASAVPLLLGLFTCMLALNGPAEFYWTWRVLTFSLADILTIALAGVLP
jgi:hypothetical protein